MPVLVNLTLSAQGYSIDDCGSEANSRLAVGEERHAAWDLRLHGSHDIRMRMTNEHRTRPQQKIDIFVPGDVPDPAGAALTSIMIGGRSNVSSPWRPIFTSPRATRSPGARVSIAAAKS